MISRTLLILMSSFFVAQAMQQASEPIQKQISTQEIEPISVQAAAATSVQPAAIASQNINVLPAREISVQNLTSHAITILFQRRNEDKMKRRTLVPKQRYDVEGDLDNIIALYVIPHGKIKGNFYAEKLTLGYWPLQNLVEFVHAGLHVFGTGRLFTLTVNNGFLGFFSPYVFKVIEGKPAVDVNTLWDVFPRANKIRDEISDEFHQFSKDDYLNNPRIKRINARYFLNLELDATYAEVNEAHRELRSLWEQRLNNTQNLGEQAVALEALKFINLAHLSITEGGPYAIEFEQMVATLGETPIAYVELRNCQL